MNFLRGLTSNHIDGVCEGVHASHILAAYEFNKAEKQQEQSTKP
jgi:hypothetical protein